MLQEINVHCVFGDKDAKHVENVLIPSILSATKLKVNLRFLNFTPGSTRKIQFEDIERLSLETLLSDSDGIKGFGENHNILFREFKPKECFLIINPDCIATENMIDIMLTKFLTEPGSIGLVEAAQWPFNHPKEFDEKTGDTPWASGACVLVNSDFYLANEGMDNRFFLYVEDVDLSWASWLAGYRVVHLPNAKVIHFTDGPHRSQDSWNSEYLYGLCNHVLLMEKYFGPAGKTKALKHVRAQVSDQLFAWVEKRVASTNFKEIPDQLRAKVRRTPQIKSFGKGLYHRLRKS
jgi:hypothetical protein